MKYKSGEKKAQRPKSIHEYNDCYTWIQPKVYTNILPKVCMNTTKLIHEYNQSYTWIQQKLYMYTVKGIYMNSTKGIQEQLSLTQSL